MAPRYAESYIKGIHDFDGSQILKNLLQICTHIGLLRFSSKSRALGTLFWNCTEEDEVKKSLKIKIGSFGQMRELFPSQKKEDDFITDIKVLIDVFVEQNKVFSSDLSQEAAEYLFEEIAEGGEFVISHDSAKICHGFTDYLKTKIYSEKFKEAVEALEGDIPAKYELIRNWVFAYIKNCLDEDSLSYCEEAAALIFTDTLRERKINEVSLTVDLSKMSGSHKLVEKGNYKLNFNEFMDRLSDFEKIMVPKFNHYVELKKSLTEQYRTELRLNEFTPRILTSFVRNRLIDELYLPLIGDNLAKQIGVSGENKRTDLMGMLLLISPPGYGKTTLMEYIANRLGLIFMKINAPAIGHHVTSLDPSEAPNAAAREEMKKLNLAFEMGDNVMIYLDDIQHSNPELLQKFISLCDGQRKIEGVYKGQPKTYDLRGRKVVVCMAGNPYTESGEKFQIPDMLANRADTYNLGDIIGDTAKIFNLSYIENSLTSNPILNKLTSRSQKDLYSLIKIAETDSREGVELEGSYSVEEMNEFVSVLKKMIIVRDIISKINAEYIRSAAMADEYRTEPPFKLQGSYRNMNKIAEKILPVMNDEELKTLVISHYENESQTLTSGAEFNILRFKELFEVAAQEDHDRLAAIRKTFEKNQLFKGVDESDPMAQVIVQMGQFTDGLEKIQESISSGMKSLPEMASALKPSESKSSIGFSEEAVEQLKVLGDSIAAAMKTAAPAKSSKKTDDLDIIPDQVKIINTVPDFFTEILRDQLELMRTWMESIHKVSSENNSQLGALEAIIKDVDGKYNQLLDNVEDSPKPEVKKTRTRKKS